MGEETILATVPIFPPRPQSPILRRGEQYLISIACDEVHLHWCLHGSIETDLSPVVFWTTGHIPAGGGGEGGLSLRGRIATLSDHLPARAHEYVFGSADAPRARPSPYEAIAASIRRPDLHVCVVSDIPEQTALILKLWSAVPSVLPTTMGGTDFFTREQGQADAMRVHRLAMLRGAAEIYDFPVLVLDCGGARGGCPSKTTYTASDALGRICGGGTGPGLRSSPGSRMSSDSAADNLLDDDDLLDRAVDRAIRISAIGDAESDGKEDGALAGRSFAKENEVALVLIQLALSVRGVAAQWLGSLDGDEPCGSSSLHDQSSSGSSLPGGTDADTSTMKGEADKQAVPSEAVRGLPSSSGPCSSLPNRDDDLPMRYVIFTGKDGERMWRLCQLHYSSNSGGNVDPFTKRRVMFRYQNNLVHYGIAAVLMKIIQGGQWTASEWRDSVNRMDDPVSFLGVRVAKRFALADDDSCAEEDDFHEDDTIFRGSVVGIQEESTTSPAKRLNPTERVKYIIKYDDEDREIVTKTELQEMIELYRDVGDKRQGGVAKTTQEFSGTHGENPQRTISRTREAPETPLGSRKTKGAPAPLASRRKRSRTIPNGEVYVNRRVAKVFETEIFFGAVTGYLPPDGEAQSPYWHVQYDDGDEEDFDPTDLQASFKLYKCAKVLDNADGDGF